MILAADDLSLVAFYPHPFFEIYLLSLNRIA